VGATVVGALVGETVLTTTVPMATMDPSTLDSNWLWNCALKLSITSVTFEPIETVIFVTTFTEATGLDVTESECTDELLSLRTETRAVINAAESADVVSTDVAKATSVVVMTAETSTANRRDKNIETKRRLVTLTAVVATPVAAAIAVLASLRLVPPGNAYVTSIVYSTETIVTSLTSTLDDAAADCITTASSKADRFVRDSFASNKILAASVGAAVGGRVGAELGTLVSAGVGTQV
jgi:hypothetical protein